MSELTRHTIGEAMAYFRFRSINCCIGSRCFVCDIEWDELQAASKSDDLVTQENAK